MKLTHKQLSTTAKAINVSERAIERLLGSTSVEVLKEVNFEEEVDLHHVAQKASERFELGLRLQGDTPIAWTNAVEQLCLSSLKEYRNNCPQVFTWLVSGNFDPKKAPDNVNRAKIFHASRTALRLRAKILREVQKALRL